jgi:hypothetical protein
MLSTVSWSVEGSYFESCSCEAICPCRRIDGVPGGRSTYGECLGVLSWLIESGHANGVALDGLGVAMATRYHDDEPGSPWRFVLYVDERADPGQRDLVEAIWTGALGGDALRHFPWAWKEAERVAVRPVAIELSHAPRRQWLRIRDRRVAATAKPATATERPGRARPGPAGYLVTVRIRDRYDGPETVTCVIPGHEQAGEELVADEVRVDDGPLRFELQGNCGYAARFSYAG